MRSFMYENISRECKGNVVKNEGKKDAGNVDTSHLLTLCMMTVPHKPLLPAVLSTLDKAQSSFTITISTFIPSCFARSAAIPKFNLFSILLYL